MNAESDQAAGLRAAMAGGARPSVPRRLRCIAVGSGKGGVGKTVLSVGLSCALVKLGYRALLLDADLGLANVDLQMGIDPALTLQDVVFGNCSIEEAVIRGEGRPDVLAAASGSPELVDMGNARREMLVDELIRFAAAYDFMVIDVGAGIGSSATTFLAAAPEVLVVVANEPTSIMDAYSLVKVVSRDGHGPSIMMAVNMVRSLREGELLAERLNGITRRFLNLELSVAGVVTYDPVVGDAIRARAPVLEYAAQSAPAQCIQELAETVVANRRCAPAGAGLSRGFFNKLAGVTVDPASGADGAANAVIQ